MAPQSSSSATTTSVQVALRIRPPTNQDSTSIPARFQRTVIHATSSNTVSIEATSANGSGSGTLSTPSTPSSNAAAKKQLFSFDQVHTPNSTQYDLFVSTAKPLVSRFVEGFNCTILAYGQTSSGKTFTMTGIDLDADPVDPNNNMGIIPRAVSNIFSTAKQLKEERGGAWNFNVKASFIEIYNEDLIDLLSMDDSGGGRREVQIREDKDGHIIWGGLREVNVKNSAEVMSLLRKGTSIRRTNETDMNAQSSRSHAIFSLTLTQKRYTGSTPPRSSSPLPPAGRSPSRLARPGSMITSPTSARVASPTFGRPSTPSFAAAMGRGGLRPSSALGHVERRTNADEEHGEWITIVSKFHFVDLAGSERLKRTAAAGERIKEGISINSGLLALGNVISALGDPSRSKSHTASHVPYRDSKLTRLLQDSLGGNAHTLMIACVSPAEWNANETVNTLKYANRARNIKNHAVLNEKEDGWDDVEWLQGTVTRLRRELKTIKDGGVVAIDNSSSELVDSNAGKKVLAQMTDLRSTYETMRTKYVERTEELTRLRRELAEQQRMSAAETVNAPGKYEEIVGPVIEEYEKSIATIEAELSLNKAALRHTNELVEEKEEELTAMTERHAATELYIEELRGRVAKLTERESSTEAYVRDLEEKIKSYDETSMSSSESLTDLKREIIRFREAESSSAQYIADLEARLGRSDDSVLALQQSVERLESECERRRDEVKTLTSRLETLREDGDSWRSDLEEREKKVKELESKMIEWEAKKQEAGNVRARLGGVVAEVASAKKSLEIDIANTPQSSESGSSSSTSPVEPLSEALKEPGVVDSALKKQLLALQQTHTATLADLSSVSAKYRDALREISDLAAQIQEAKLSNPEPLRSESPDKLATDGKREIQRNRDATQFQWQAPFFSPSGLDRVAARENSTYFAGVRPNLSISLPSPSPVNGNERSVTSLEKEIMRLQEVLKEREAEITILEESLKKSQEQKNAVALIEGDPPSKSKEKLNGVAAATLSPKTLNQFDHIRRTMENGNGYAHTDTGSDLNSVSAPSEADESLERLNELMLSMAQKESHHREVVDSLTTQLSQVQRQLDDLTTLSRDQTLNMSTEIDILRKKHDDQLVKSDQAEIRAVELAEVLKKAEADYNNEIQNLREQHRAAMDAKVAELDELLTRMKEDHSLSSSRLRDELNVASAALEAAHRNYDQKLEKVKTDFTEELRLRLQEANNTLDLARDEHQKTLNKLTAEHAAQLKHKEAEANADLQRTEEEYYNALTKLRGDHADALAKQAAELNGTLERLRDEHAAQLRMAEIAREGSLSESQSSQARALQDLQDVHDEAINKKEHSFSEEMNALKADHDRILAMKTDGFALDMDRLRLEYESALSKLKEERRVEVDSLQMGLAEAKADLTTAELKASKDMDQAFISFKEQQSSALQELQQTHDDQVVALKTAHSMALQSARQESEEETARLVQLHLDDANRLSSQLEQEVDTAKASITSLEEQHKSTIQTLREQHERVLSDHTAQFTTTISSLEQEHRSSLQSLQSQRLALSDERESLSKSLTVLQAELQAMAETVQLHISDNTRLSENLASLEEKYCEQVQVAADAEGEQSKLIQEASKRDSLVEELDRHRSILAEMQENLQKVKDEKDAMQVERSRAENQLREMQAQIARSASPPHSRPVPERNMSYTRSTSIPSMKLPPPTPPPSGPPPPAPMSRVPAPASVDASLSTSSGSSTTVATSLSRDSPLESPLTSLPPNSPPPGDVKLFVKLEEQAKHIDEQEVMIKTLNKQLTHCEGDLQTHMDLVTTLETSLGDSEKNLRKARMHATEISRERDTLNAKLEAMRNELAEAKREVVTVRKSIVEEKQSLEQRLDEERRAKERARSQLDSRMDELQRRKSNMLSGAPRTLPSFSLEGKVCLVTGGARGLGYEFCRAFADSGCTSLAIVDLKLVDATQAANDLKSYAIGRKLIVDVDHKLGKEDDFKFIGIECDVSSEEAVQKAYSKVIETFGQIDCVVASAGIVENYTAFDYPSDRIKRLYDINVHGVFYTAREAARNMIPRRCGSIILVSSMSANIVNVPQPQTPYNASKAAVKHMAASLAVEWAKTGVRVNALSPGYMLTKLTRTILEGKSDLKKTWENLTPMGRMGEPEDLAGAIVFLASDASKFMTGSEIRVDGGYCVV
ncbi:hypothetical protein H0H93_011719 [Arthromyces matolae]|nr:hypothetical protein H0H93_011719 [Arthromyces matolae]